MKAALIGLGRMGSAMATRALESGHELVVFNRSPSKAAALAERGARIAGSPGEAAREAGVAITMLADDAALHAVAEDLLAALPPGGVHVAMGTHGLKAISDLTRAHAGAGQHLVAAPVLGRPEAVAAGRLVVLAAGDEVAVARCLALLQSIAQSVIRAGGEPRTAAAMKIANNFLLGCAIEAMGEAFALVEKCGGQADAVYEMLAGGPFACTAYQTYGKIIAEKKFDTVGFTASLALKDANLALAAGEASKTPLPSAAIWRDRLLSAIANGNGERDWSVMALEQRRAAGLD